MSWFGILDHSFLLKFSMMMFIPNFPSNKTYFIMIFPLCTYMMAMWWSIVIKAIIGVGPSGTTHFLVGENSKKMYYFKYGARWMSCPKVKIYFLSNNYYLFFYNIKRFFVVGFLVTFLVPPKISTTKYLIRFEYVVTRFLVNCYGLTYMGGFFSCICWMTTSKDL
jgi:hypothetical protein